MAGGCRLIASITTSITDKTLRLFAPEIKTSKAMAAWEPVVQDAARKQGRGPVTLRCVCTPPRPIFAGTGTALGTNITCEVCCKAFGISRNRRISEAYRAAQTRSARFPLPAPRAGDLRSLCACGSFAALRCAALPG
jgi:hypothetical protein